MTRASFSLFIFFFLCSYFVRHWKAVTLSLPPPPPSPPFRCIDWMLALNRWGPSGWHFVHSVCHTFPQNPTTEESERLSDFLLMFGRNLPCPKCRRHYGDFMKHNMPPSHELNRERAVRLMNDCHNSVNRRLNRRQFSLDEHYAWMKSSHALGKHEKNSKFRLQVTVVILATIVAVQFVNASASRKKTTIRR